MLRVALMMLALAVAGVSGCTTPAGLTLKAGMAQATGTIRTYTVPVKDFDPAKEAATCRATAGCTSFLVIPVKKDNSQPMKGPFTSMSVTLKATSTGTWLNVDPADRARVDELCVGTFLLAADVKPSPSPSPAKGNNSTASKCPAAPKGWSFTRGKKQLGNTISSDSVQPAKLNLKAVAQRCADTPKCTSFAVFPSAAAKAKGKGTTLTVELKSASTQPFVVVDGKARLGKVCFGTYSKA